MSDLRNAILGARDFKSEAYTVEKWGGLRVELRSMSARLRAKIVDAVFASQRNSKGAEDVGLLLIPLFPEIVQDGLRDPESGERVFGREDLKLLEDKDGEVLQDLANRIIELSAMGQRGVEQEAKNSSSTQSGEVTTS